MSVGRVRMPPARPPAGLRPRFETVPAGSVLHRIYAPRHYPQPRPHTVGPTTFRRFGPTERFDHHMPDPLGGPCVDPARGIYYAGVDLWDCALEVFGRLKMIRLADNRYAVVTVVKPLLVIDLRGLGARAIGTDATISKGGPRRATQAWGRYLHTHEDVFSDRGQPVDGLMFSNAHNDGRSFALFERASRSLERFSDRALRSSAVRTRLELWAQDDPEIDVEP